MFRPLQQVMTFLRSMPKNHSVIKMLFDALEKHEIEAGALGPPQKKIKIKIKKKAKTGEGSSKDLERTEMELEDEDGADDEKVRICFLKAFRLIYQAFTKIFCSTDCVHQGRGGLHVQSYDRG